MLRHLVQNAKFRLILLSFLMLFVELALIRWLGSNIVYLSYFSNFVLLGSFLGIGVGFLRGTSKSDLFPWAATSLGALIIFVSCYPVEIDRSGTQLIYFGGYPSGLPIWATLPIVFALVAVIMASIAQGVARTFALFEPLEAYRLDIIGSLTGIAVFSLLSFSSAPPLLWGLVVCGVMLLLYGRSVRLLQLVALAGVIIVLGHESFEPGNYWSPYYKISILNAAPGLKELNVNGIPHQVIESIARRKATEPVYFYPYQRLRGNPLRNVLIIGAGNGGDVAIALANGAKHVDAVEIDPRIYQVAGAMNPNRPYDDPRVTVHINDGRAFLQQARTRYDLILFALPDSLILVAGQSSLRLESYLFTLEAMKSARAHLTPNGSFGMYNFYREDWLIDRLAGTLQTTYGHAPCLDSFGRYGRFALLMVSRQAGALNCPTMWSATAGATSDVVDDDHPFVYLQHRSIPTMYLITIAAILIASFGLIRGVAGPFTQMRGYVDLFFMGAAFLLLETKNVVQFALLFGTTWFVNALVFFGILLSVYLAIEVARRVRVTRPGVLYIALFATLALAFAVPQQDLLALNVPLRFCLAAGLAFMPVFLANLVFAERFRDVGSSTSAFAANLLGAMVGGILEYSSLIVGYHALLIIIALLYGCAFLFGRKQLVGAQDAQPAQTDGKTAAAYAIS
ncbi:MAG TPA: hypothetical protein VFE17_00650 [Candidatus Baltobacteraceae bacterium]|nr:hypothetical protein [Candidatus Baltobacteraceae bacterium]